MRLGLLARAMWVALSLLALACGGDGDDDDDLAAPCLDNTTCESTEYCRFSGGTPGEGECSPCSDEGCADACPADNYRACLDGIRLLSCEGGASGMLVMRDCELLGKVCGTETLDVPICENAP